MSTIKTMGRVLALAGVALISAQASAQALVPGVDPINHVVRLSGASAQDRAIREAVLDICVPGTLSTLSDTGVFPSGGLNAFFCTMPPASTGLGANSNVLVLKRTTGGSGQSVVGTCNVTGVQQLLVDASCVFNAGTQVWDCNADPVLAQSDGGVSDLEIDKLPAGQNRDVCVANGIDIVERPTFATIFGIPVTTALRNSLQRVQGLTAGSELEVDMPSLSKIQVQSLFAAGGIRSWTNVMVGAQTLPNAVVAAGGVAPANTRVHLCRRQTGSGTLAQYEVKFHNLNCGVAGANALATDNTTGSTPVLNTAANWTNFTGAPPFGPVVIDTSSAGNLGGCLHELNAINMWAIGHQSMENNASGAQGYRFIKIDGVAPTSVNVIENNYFDWVESTGLRRTPASGIGAVQLAVVDAIFNQSGSAANVADLTAPFLFPFGQSGYVALATVPGNVASNPTNLASPVATASHVSGGQPNSCRTPLVRAQINNQL